MGTLMFSVLMYLQSPYYNSSFWDSFRQFYNRRKNSESQKLRILKDQHSNTNNINEKQWAKNKTWLRTVKTILWREKPIYFLPIQPLGEKKNQKGNVIFLWRMLNLATHMNKEILCNLLTVTWKRWDGHLCISSWAHIFYSLETLSAMLAITFFCSHHQTYGSLKKKHDQSLSVLMVLGRAPKKIATLHCFSFPWLLKWYILSR